jgi:hypothetical protein
VIVLISRVFRDVRSWGDYSVGTLEHEEWFSGIRRSVYKERLVPVGGFPFLLSLLVVSSSKQYYNFGNLFELLSFLVLLGPDRDIPTRTEHPNITCLSPTINTARYMRTSPIIMHPR